MKTWTLSCRKTKIDIKYTSFSIISCKLRAKADSKKTKTKTKYWDAVSLSTETIWTNPGGAEGAGHQHRRPARDDREVQAAFKKTGGPVERGPAIQHREH